jgi:hypothetical protein
MRVSAMKQSPQKVGYVLYIDEAGDDGIQTVRPIDANGASEWLIFGAVLVRSSNGVQAVDWIRNFRSTIKGAQRPDLHFYTLSDTKRLAVCEYLATLPVRCFAVISNKRNMRGYRNERAEKIYSKNPFYNWLLRLLLERATNYCAARTMKDYGEPRTMRIEIGARGGFFLSQFKAYLTWICNQSKAGSLYLTKGDLAWNMIDVYEIETFPAAKRAGIQLADIVASAFKQAVELRPDGTCRTMYAEAPRPRLAFDKHGRIPDFGIKIMPHPFWKAGAVDAQIAILERFGYPRDYLVSPGSSLAKPFLGLDPSKTIGI